jgi:hypothetical protein
MPDHVRGRFFSWEIIREPRADGSVHMPYSDQKEGMDQTSGNEFKGFRLDLSQNSSDE